MTKYFFTSAAALALTAGSALAAVPASAQQYGTMQYGSASGQQYASSSPYVAPGYGAGYAQRSDTVSGVWHPATPEVGPHGFALFPPDATGGGNQ